MTGLICKIKGWGLLSASDELCREFFRIARQNCLENCLEQKIKYIEKLPEKTEKKERAFLE